MLVMKYSYTENLNKILSWNTTTDLCIVPDTTEQLMTVKFRDL